jgi:hypothetical protein
MEAEPPKTTANNLALAAIPLGIAVIIGNSIVLGLVYSRLIPSDFLQIAASAFVTAEGSLVAIWIAFGSRPLPIRLTFAIPGVAVVFLPKFLMWDGAAQFPFGIGLVLRDFAITGGAIAFVFNVLLVAGVSVPLLTARVASWRLIQIPTEADAINAKSAKNSNQFTLRQMFGWTLAAAMVAGLARLVVRPDYFRFSVATVLLVEARKRCGVQCGGPFRDVGCSWTRTAVPTIVNRCCGDRASRIPGSFTAKCGSPGHFSDRLLRRVGCADDLLRIALVPPDWLSPYSLVANVIRSAEL